MNYHVTMSASDDCLLESEVRRKELAPRSVFELTTRSLTTDRVPLRNAGVGGLFFGRIGGRYGERQELTWLGVSRIGS